MTPHGPNRPGGGADESGEGGQERPAQTPGGDGAPDPEAAGWLPPENRPWRHPSELSPPAPGAPASRRAAAAAATAHRWRPWAMVLVGTSAVAAVVTGFVLLDTVGSGGPGGEQTVADSSTTTTSLVRGTSGTSVPAVAVAAVHSMVALHVGSPSGTTTNCGVAVAGGGLVATTADALVGATSVTARMPDGAWRTARVVGIDRSSDVALVRVPENLPLPRFATTAATLAPGRPALELAMDAASGGARWSVGTVDAASAPVVSGSAAGMAAIAATVDGVAPVAGDLLVDPSGAVTGILDRTGSTAGVRTAEVFLPTGLVLGVSAELATTGRVRHGWLDVSAQSTPVGARAPGVLVARVDPKGPSANALRTGDVIVGVGNQPVRSMADLRSTLYVLGAGTPVELDVHRGISSRVVAVRLAASP